jgi:hypothetical protein
MRPLSATALIIGVAAAAVLGLAATAHAALPNSDWTEYQPANNYLPVTGPESCVPGTQFCMVISWDTADTQTPNQFGIADLVTTNAGKTWTAYNNLSPAINGMAYLSCSSVKVCLGIDGSDLVQTTDGGVTWRKWEPSAWSTLRAKPQSIMFDSLDCVSANSCWVTGYTEAAGNVFAPYLAQVWNGTVFPVTDLPTLGASSTGESYVLNGFSCGTAVSCVAVGGTIEQGGDNVTLGTSVAITTSDDGAHWRLGTSTGGTLNGVSCVRTGRAFFPSEPASTCFAVGRTYDPDSASPGAIVLVSRDSGKTWSSQYTSSDGWSLGFISCADASHCWATTNDFTQTSMLGTADGGTTWTPVTSDYAVGENSAQVAYLNASTWVATTAARIFVTNDDGGLAG